MWVMVLSHSPLDERQNRVSVDNSREFAIDVAECSKVNL